MLLYTLAAALLAAYGLRLISLRDYQSECVDGLRAVLRQLAVAPFRFGRKPAPRVILQAETGGGKTVMAAELTRQAWEKGSAVLFLAHRRELVFQTSARLKEHGVPHGVIMAGVPRSAGPVQIASKASLVRWALEGCKIDLPPANLVIIDECHLSLSHGWQKLLRKYADAVQVGLTATPALANGKGLGGYYKGMYQSVPPSRLIADGWLCKTKVYAPNVPNLKGVPRSGFDYSKPALNRVMDKPKLVGNIVETWLAKGEGGQTVCFASGVSHSLSIVAAFNEAGVPAAHVDGETPDREREEIFREFWAGKVRILSNVAIMPEGIDMPPACCVILARPTRSFVLYRQMIGRVKRPWNQAIAEASGKPFTYPAGWVKEHAVVLDHAGNVFLHGMPDMDVAWDLDPDQTIQDQLKKKNKPEPKPTLCPKCHCVFAGGNTCPECGFVIVTPPKNVVNARGQLTEFNGGRLADMTDPKLRENHWHYCLRVCYWKGWTAGRAAAMYKGKTGNFPEDWLPNIPDRGDWGVPVKALFPQYSGTRKKTV